MLANDNKLAKEIALWKESVAERWDSIYVVSKDEDALQDISTGHKIKVTYVIDEQGLNDAVGLELVFLKKRVIISANNSSNTILRPMPLSRLTAF